MNVMPRNALAAVFCSVLGLLSTTTVQATCAAADQIFKQSLEQSGDQRFASLQQALSLCPGHPRSLNNLGVLSEQQGDLDTAERLYRQAIESDPEFVPPYAGIADVLTARGRYAEAAAAYERFLQQLESARRLGVTEFDHSEAQYRARRDLAREKAGLPPVVVDAHAITERLRERVVSSCDAPSGCRSIGAEYVQYGEIDLPVYFAHDSVRVAAKSQPQITAIAEALTSVALRGNRIRIEGHTDNSGADAYNQRLSKRRAQAVRDLLVAGHGISADRLEIQGFGESKPVAENDSEAGRAQNRRVTLRNIGGAQSVLSSY